MNVAAVDIGTNSTNLLVSGNGVRVFRTVDTRLGQGVDASRRLAPEAIDRTLAVLRDYRSEIDRHHAEQLVVVATSASRDAENRDEFFDPAEAVLGVRPSLLSGEDEGRLAFAAVIGGPADRRIDAPRPLVVLDIGGGSTELMVGSDQLDSVRSVDVGSVRLTETFLHGDPPRPEELTNAIGEVADHVEDLLRDVPELADGRSLVGIGGTMTTVAAVEIGIDVSTDQAARDRLHGVRLTRDAVEEVFRTLATERLADRVHNPGLPATRAGVIVGGLCVLVAVMRRLQFDGITVSTNTLLDGICAELLAGGAAP
jgi:exopolyphosphatase/guanosine-5'-triphosphate,3'-diphosphate pyrophosphatase